MSSASRTSGPAGETGRVLEADGVAPLVLVEMRDEEGTPGLEMRFEIPVPPDALLQILWDPAHLRRLFSTIRSVRVQRSGGGDPPTELELVYEVNAVVRTLRYVLHRQLFPDPQGGGGRIRWRELGGDLRRIRGGWEVAPGDSPETSRVVYRTFVDITRLVPTRFVVRAGKRKAKVIVAQVKREAVAIYQETGSGSATDE